jgi:hypothetical protein
MAKRGKAVFRPKGWVSESYPAPLSKQDQRLQALTKGSPGFRRMTTVQKLGYLNNLRHSFPGNTKLVSMMNRYARELASRRERTPAVRDMRQEQARRSAATASARTWLTKTSRGEAYSAAQVPGYDRAPHGMTTMTPKGLVHGPAVSEVPWIDPRLQAPLQPAYARPYSHGQIVAGGTLYSPMTYGAVQ